jgi:hypothetical protein
MSTDIHFLCTVGKPLKPPLIKVNSSVSVLSSSFTEYRLMDLCFQHENVSDPNVGFSA